jgi:hypothetical protein
MIVQTGVHDKVHANRNKERKYWLLEYKIISESLGAIYSFILACDFKNQILFLLYL